MVAFFFVAFFLAAIVYSFYRLKTVATFRYHWLHFHFRFWIFNKTQFNRSIKSICKQFSRANKKTFFLHFFLAYDFFRKKSSKRSIFWHEEKFSPTFLRKKRLRADFLPAFILFMYFSRSFFLEKIGSSYFPVEVECLLTRHLPHIQVIGCNPARAREIRENVMAALEASGYRLPARKLTIRIQGMRGTGEGIELAVAIAWLQAAKLVPYQEISFYSAAKLSLDGALCPLEIPETELHELKTEKKAFLSLQKGDHLSRLQTYLEKSLSKESQSTQEASTKLLLTPIQWQNFFLSLQQGLPLLLLGNLAHKKADILCLQRKILREKYPTYIWELPLYPQMSDWKRLYALKAWEEGQLVSLSLPRLPVSWLRDLFRQKNKAQLLLECEEGVSSLSKEMQQLLAQYPLYVLQAQAGAEISFEEARPSKVLSLVSLPEKNRVYRSLKSKIREPEQLEQWKQASLYLFNTGLGAEEAWESAYFLVNDSWVGKKALKDSAPVWN